MFKQVKKYNKGGYSKEGYRKNSPHVNRDYNIINSNLIGTDNLAFPIVANGKILHPNTGDYIFPESQVYEKPLHEFKSGGSLHKGEASAILKYGKIYGHDITDKQKVFFQKLAKKENKGLSKKQEGGFQQLQSNVNNWQTDENYQHPINYNQQTPLYKIPEENRLQNPVQITPTGKTPEPFITNKSQTDLSFAPLLVNSIAESFATRANNNRDNNYQQSNLGNPYNYLPVTNNTNSYQNYGTQVYQMGGGVDNSQDDSDFEDMADEDFLFGVDENIEQPLVQKQEVPEEVQQPVVQEEEQVIIQPDMSIWDDNKTSDISNNTGLNVGNIRQTGSLDNDIAAIESGGNYKADNPHSSAIGKYQFLYSQWGDDIKRVTGISSPEEFKNNPKAQEEFYSYYKYNHMIPAIQRLRKYNTQGLSDDALGKLFHFKGEAGAKKYLTEGIDDTHANNISIPKYIGK